MENVILSDVKFIYDRMQDEISKNIYAERLFYNFDPDGEAYKIRRWLNYSGYDEGFLKFFRKHKSNNKVIFCAGYWGRQVKKLFPEINWNCFVDNNKCDGRTLDGLACYSLGEAQNKLHNPCFCVATRKYSDEIRRQLIESGICDDNIFLLKDYMRSLEESQYFDLPYLQCDSEGKEAFVDVGALDGFTTKRFISWCSGNYEHIYMFEPNPYMINTVGLNIGEEKNISFFEKALSDECMELNFACMQDGKEGCSRLLERESHDVHGGGQLCLRQPWIWNWQIKRLLL